MVYILLYSILVSACVCACVCACVYVGLEVNTIIGDVMGLRNSKSIELSSGEDPTRVAAWADWRIASVTLPDR